MPASDYTPSVSEVAALLRARTKDANGAEVGTFNADTRPTGDQVTSLIEDSVNELESVLGEELDEQFHDQAKTLAKFRAAMLIELSYYPEQVANGRSAYDQYRQLFEDGLPRLVEAVREAGSRGEVVGPSDAARLPVHSFPTDGGGLVGWQTKW